MTSRRPKFCYFLTDPGTLFHVYEWYPRSRAAPDACEKIGFWHNPDQPGEMPVVFAHLEEMHLVWSDAELAELERIGAIDIKKPSRVR